MSEDLEVLRHLRIARDALRDLGGYPAFHDRASAALRTLDAADAGSDCVILYRDSILTNIDCKNFSFTAHNNKDESVISGCEFRTTQPSDSDTFVFEFDGITLVGNRAR